MKCSPRREQLGLRTTSALLHKFRFPETRATFSKAGGGQGPLLTKLAVPFSSRRGRLPLCLGGRGWRSSLAGKKGKQTLSSLAWSLGYNGGRPGAESWSSRGQPWDHLQCQGAGLWDESPVHKGQARFLGNPAVWGHIHPGAELCAPKISILASDPSVRAPAGGGDGTFLLWGDSLWAVTPGEGRALLPSAHPPSPPITRRERARWVSQQDYRPLGVSARRKQLPFLSQSRGQFLRLPATCWRVLGCSWALAPRCGRRWRGD